MESGTHYSCTTFTHNFGKYIQYPIWTLWTTFQCYMWNTYVCPTCTLWATWSCPFVHSGQLHVAHFHTWDTCMYSMVSNWETCCMALQCPSHSKQWSLIYVRVSTIVQPSEKYNTNAVNIAELFTTSLDLIVDLFLAICSHKYNYLLETLVESNALKVLHDIK